MREIVSPLDGFGSPFGTRRRALAPFSPAILFAAGNDGLWFDDDPATKFFDTAGTTLAGLTQSVALELDKSRGLVLGPELVTNGTFDVDVSGWAITGSASASSVGGKAVVVANAASGGIEQAFSVVANKTYEVVSTIVSDDGVAADVRFRSGSGSILQLHRSTSTSQSVQKAIVTPTDGTLRVTMIVAAASIFPATVAYDNISVRELPGNHATQGTTTFRPTRQTDGILYDGSDDRQTTPYRPTVAGSIIARFNGATASRVVLGSQAATDGRAFLGLDASGRLAAGIGAQGTATINAGADIRNTFHTGAVTWDGTTVKLYLDAAEVYSAAQSGAVNTTVDMFKGALNANGTAAGFWQGRIEHAIALDRVLTPTEITNITAFWS
jgi:hypothetical protein